MLLSTTDTTTMTLPALREQYSHYSLTIRNVCADTVKMRLISLDRLFQSGSSSVAPAGHERAVAQFGDSRGSEEDLVAGEEPHLLVERGAPPAAQRGTEDARVDDKSHGRIAAAKSSSSTSVRSSINNASADARAGAAASSLRVTPSTAEESPNLSWSPASQHFLYFLPLPQGQAALRPTRVVARRTVYPVTPRGPASSGTHASGSARNHSLSAS